MHRALALALAASALVAGCTGAGEEPLVAPSTAGGPAANAAPQAANATAAVVRFNGPEAVLVEQWANGTFRAEQAATAHDALPWLLPVDNVVETDLTALIPRGVPVEVVLEVQAELAQGDLDLWLHAPQGAIWTYDADAPYGGHTEVRVRLLYDGGDPVVAVLAYDVLEPAAEVPYALRIGVTSWPDWMLPGVPYAVELPAGQEVRVTFGEGGAAEDTALLLFGPGDVLLHRTSGGEDFRWQPGPDATGGEYVFLLAGAGRSALVSLPGLAAAPIARPLAQDIVAGPPQTFQAGQPVDWTFDVPRQPVQVGFEVFGGTVALNVEASLNGPEGELLSFAVDGGPWLQPGWGAFTRVGEAGLAPGAYAAHLAYEIAAGETVTGIDYVVHYRR